MADNAQKTPFALSMNRFVENKMQGLQSLQPKSLPGQVTAVKGSLVTVAFDVQGPYTLPTVTMPLFGPEWIRYPIKVGTKGICVAASAGPGSGSGQGGTTAPDLSLPGNLSALVFLPIGNTGFSPTPDAQSLVLYGTNGVII